MRRSSPRLTPAALAPALARRSLLTLLAGTVAGALVPGRLGLPARAAVASSDRKFLFVLARGGWDPTWVFAPEFDNSSVDMPGDDSEPATQSGHTWVSSASRPSVDALFTNYGSRICTINGLVVPSVAHEQCSRLLFTGGTSPGVDDFQTRLASGASSHLPLGNVIFSGPSYTSPGATGVVRLGRRGQLAALLDGSCTDDTFPSLHLPTPSAQGIEDSLVAARASRASRAALAPASRGEQQLISAAYVAALADAASISELSDLLAGTEDDPLAEMLAAGVLLGRGGARCVTLADDGDLDATWDQHSVIAQQSKNYECLFGNLLALLDSLAATPGQAGGADGGSLLDEVTVVVCSEMGRYPQLNSAGGKDHWPTTSLLLIGGGVRGGQGIGDYDGNMGGTPVVLSTGELDPDGVHGGVLIEPLHIGATLLAIAGMDPVEALGPGAEAIGGAIEGG
ncbi:MAG: DUF1501 domain-containing protein [Myxococcales bacterium]|nr:DUF1501 domain-containing protein [Myxococcales bacterium]